MSDLVGKMKTAVSFYTNTPAAQGQGNKDNYNLLVSTKGYLRKSGGNRAFSLGDISTESTYLLTIRYQAVIEQNLGASVKIISGGFWYTIENWKKEDERNDFIEFTLNRKDPAKP